jgi:hypothetical protein
MRPTAPAARHKQNCVSHSLGSRLDLYGIRPQADANYAVSQTLRLESSMVNTNPATDPVLPTAPGKACPLCLPESKSAGSVAYRETQYK